MKLKRLVGLALALFITLSCLQGLVVNAAEAAGENDEEISCYCSFDMEIDSSFKDYPIYQFAEDGILHVSAYRSQSGTYFEFGAKDKFAVEAHKQILGDRSWQKGEWMILPAWTEAVKWDSVDFIEEDKDNTKLIMRNVQRFCPDNPFKAARSFIYLAVDMIESANGMTIQMYLYNGENLWDMDDWGSGEVKHLSSTADYIPASFDEIRLTQYGRPRTRSLFRQKGGAWSGDSFSDISDNKENDSKPPTEKEPQPEDKNKEDSESNSNPGNKENEQDKNSGNKDENKPSENIKPTEKGINQGENVPESYRGLTKEESLEKYNAYYDADGNWHHRFYYTGTTPNGLRRTTDAVNKIEFTVPQNMDGVSSDGTTRFTIYEIEQTLRFEGKERSRKDTVTILQANGNIGTEYFEIGNTTWRIPKGSTVSNFPGLDENTSYYGWNEVEEINEKYIETVGRGSEAGSIKIHFADSARTGIESLEFDFDGMHTKMFYDEIDYIGPFFTFFMGYGLDDEWLEAAKRLGLTVKAQEEE